MDILLLAISAVLSGAKGWEDIEDFGHLKLDWLKQYGTFNAGIPKHDTIARVIPKLLQNARFRTPERFMIKACRSLRVTPLMNDEHDLL